MKEQDGGGKAQTLFSTLHERAKELSCLYRIEEILSHYDLPLEEVFRYVIAAVPTGWQYPEYVQAQIIHGTEVFESQDYVETLYSQCAEIRVQDAPVGRLCVSYREPVPEADDGPFLKGETKLLHTIAERIGHFILHQRLRHMFEERQEPGEEKPGWNLALDLLRNTDPKLFIRVSRKMMNYLAWRGVPAAKNLLQRFGEDRESTGVFSESNLPQRRDSLGRFFELSEETFRIAAANLTEEEIFDRIQKWIGEERSYSAVKSMENVYATLSEVIESMQHCQRLMPRGVVLPRSKTNSVRVSLIRRFFNEQLEYINIAKKYLSIEDFFGLTERLIYPPGSHGKLGGKSAGLFLASRILRQSARRVKAVGEIKTPKTWYITSDGIIYFQHYNNLEEVSEQKYKDIDIIRQEYPHIVQLFKNSTFPQEIVKGLSVALDDFGDVPLIVRSSSLLEDRLGTAFAGKYKSLFLANQGDKEKRLEALLDAVAEVYASIFNPDPIAYRAERGLLDFYEEMGIMIQEVVGRRVGRYFFPAFAGVAFSRNEFRWSPRIGREDGLLRIVPGLGTRAVDRVSDDYPVLIAPSKPNLKVNVSIEDVLRYSPRRIDVIDLENNAFVTLDIKTLLKEVGHAFPAASRVFSIHRDGILQKPMGLATNLGAGDAVATFDGLIAGTPFVSKVDAILKTLEAALGVPVDIEFASDGDNFYLLQCRPQSFSSDDAAMDIPAHIPDESVLFTAGKFVSNGSVPDITHIVYVDPGKYGDIGAFSDLLAVGQAVGKLNKLLPRKKFILMGPGRWGSRGDVKLGVRVTYSDISNTALLVEVARKKGNYVPDVSFGTHFFQDLVESGIRYLPLYPDDDGVRFNETFLLGSANILEEILPEFAALSDTLRVIDVPASEEGRVLRVLMNAEREQAVGMFVDPTCPRRMLAGAGTSVIEERKEHSRWRMHMAEEMARRADAEAMGIKALYVFGSTCNGTAGPNSDINLIVRFQGDARRRQALESWLQGWSQSLAEANAYRTGFRSEGLLDVHILNDEDLASGKNEFAAKIQGTSDPARELPLGGSAVC
ncbi:MAG: PEP/pyruvate-binding domain-containing protein [Acidobacteriota bacterium]|nr:PEP/pyruvate-binding domain-containing protein [Acidobacteriota bacterium]